MEKSNNSTHLKMRQNNVLNVFNCIRRSGPITKRNIQKETKLSWGTVSDITSGLINASIIKKLNPHETYQGRKPFELDINSDSNFFIGIDVSLEGLTGVMIDLKSRLIEKVFQELEENNIQSVLAQIEKLSIYFLEKYGGIKKILGIGIALPGYVDNANGVWKYSHHFSGAKDINIRLEIFNRCGLPVEIDHDPNCVALSEQMIGHAQNVKNFILIRISVGIGAAIIINTNVHRGYNMCAGEFGHTMVQEGGSLCECGRFGCLEEYSSYRAIIKYAKMAAKSGESKFLKDIYEKNGTISLKNVMDCALHGDNISIDIMQNAARYMGIAISNLINVLNPDLIVLSSELCKCDEYFVKPIKFVINKHVWKCSEINLDVTEFSGESAAIGAAALHINNIVDGKNGLLVGI